MVRTGRRKMIAALRGGDGLAVADVFLTCLRDDRTIKGHFKRWGERGYNCRVHSGTCLKVCFLIIGNIA